MLSHQKVSKYCEEDCKWICQVLKYSGINNKLFKSHCVRIPSTLKAKNIEFISLSQILKKGQWSKELTWQKIYNKEIFSETTTFQSIFALWTADEENTLLETCSEGWENSVLDRRKFYEVKLYITIRSWEPPL